MHLDRKKIELIMAKNQITICSLAENYGASRNRIYAILNSRRITPVCAGKFAKALGVDVTEIID